jgi:hypothetical protein
MQVWGRRTKDVRDKTEREKLSLSPPLPTAVICPIKVHNF